MKVAVNSCIGGFNLSYKALMRMAELKSVKLYAYKQADEHDYKNNAVVPCDGSEDDMTLIYYSLCELKCTSELTANVDYQWSSDRTDPTMIQAIEELGAEASGRHSHIVIMEIPDDVDFYINEDDTGYESIHEKHRSWSPNFVDC